MDWGTRIIITIGAFILLMGTMVVLSFQQNIEVVSEDYYEQELVYQDRINEKNNANALSETVTHIQLPVGVEFQFPLQFQSKKTTGKILFFRPSDQTKDFETPILLNSDSKQFISSEYLSKGKYDLKISWTVDEKTYLKEEVIVIQ